MKTSGNEKLQFERCLHRTSFGFLSCTSQDSSGSVGVYSFKMTPHSCPTLRNSEFYQALLLCNNEFFKSHF